MPVRKYKALGDKQQLSPPREAEHTPQQRLHWVPWASLHYCRLGETTKTAALLVLETLVLGKVPHPLGGFVAPVDESP